MRETEQVPELSLAFLYVINEKLVADVEVLNMTTILQYDPFTYFKCQARIGLSNQQKTNG